MPPRNQDAEVLQVLLTSFAGSLSHATRRAARLSSLQRKSRSQWGRVEDEATESMTPRKPDALNMQGGLLLRQKPHARTQLLLVCALCFVQLLVLAALGGGVTTARLLEQRVETALEGAPWQRRSTKPSCKAQLVVPPLYPHGTAMLARCTACALV